MKYTVGQLAALTGVSTRTLRYYDSIGLLSPAYSTEAGYRTRMCQIPARRGA